MLKLEPGEVALIGPRIEGHQVIVRQTETGETECGVLVPPECAATHGAVAYMEMGERVRPGVRRVKQYIPFTSKGPSQVASSAYRSGWDTIFGSRSGADECGPSGAN